MSRNHTAALATALFIFAATAPAFAGETAAPAKKAADKQAQVKAEQKVVASKETAAETRVVPAAPAVIGSVPDAASAAKVDPLAAALAKAASHAAAPAAPRTAKHSASPATGGLADLHETCRRNAEKTLLSRHDEKVPSGEVVVHMKATTLSESEISTVIVHQLSRLQYCYESLAARGKAVDGQTSLHFVVEPKGNVSSAEIHGTGADHRLLESCVARQVERWRFPAADAPTIVDYPLVFESNSHSD